MSPARRTHQSATCAPSQSWASVEGWVSWVNNPAMGVLVNFYSRSWAWILPLMPSTHTASHSAPVIRGVIKKCLRLVLPTRPSPTVELRDYKEPSAFDLVADYVNAEVDLRGRQTEPRPLAQSFTEQFLLQSGAHDPESNKAIPATVVERSRLAPLLSLTSKACTLHPRFAMPSRPRQLKSRTPFGARFTASPIV